MHSLTPVLPLLAQAATTQERGVVLAQVFFAVLAIAGGIVGAYFLVYLLAAPVLTAAGAARARRIMTGYLIVGPLVIVNLVLVFWLFAAQFIAINYLYGTVASPARVFESAFASASGGGAPAGSPLVIVLDRLKRSAGFGQSGYYAPMAGFTRVVWWCYGAFNWGILGSLLFAMLRDLGMTSWSLVAAPVQREVQGRPWWDLVKRALGRFFHLLFYTLIAGVVFTVCAFGVLLLSYATLWMVAKLLLLYLHAIDTAAGGFPPAMLLGSVYVMMLEILGLLLFTTVLLSFIASRSISLNIEDILAGILGLPKPDAPAPRLWPCLKSGTLLLLKMLAATLPVWLVMWLVIGRFFPLILAAPIGAVLHVGVFNVILVLLKAHRDVVPLAVQAWAGRPWGGREKPKSAS